MFSEKKVTVRTSGVIEGKVAHPLDEQLQKKYEPVNRTNVRVLCLKGLYHVP